MVGVEAHVGQQLEHPFLDFAAAYVPVDDHGLGDEVAHPHPGVEGTPRVLKHGLHRAAVLPPGLRVSVADFLALEADGALGRLFQLEHHLGGGALAAARLADDAQGLAGAQLEGNAVHCLDVAGGFADEQALGHREVFFQPDGLQQRRAVGRAVGVSFGGNHIRSRHTNRQQEA